MKFFNWILVCCLACIVVFAYIFIRIGGRKESSASHTKANTQKIVIKSNKIAILKYDVTKDYFIFPKGSPTTLNVDEMKEIEKLVKQSMRQYQIQDSIQFNKLKTSNRRFSHIIQDKLLNYESYYKQIIAVTDDKGDKLVWLNCFCSNESDYWKREIVTVNDGGKCYFNVTVNLTRHRCYQLSVNGVA